MTVETLPAVGRRYCLGKLHKRPGQCHRPAGWGTDHAGVGKCKLHGGGTPIKSGLYSKIKRESLRELIAEHQANPDPLNLFSELALLRALLQDYLDRYADSASTEESPPFQPEVDPAAQRKVEVADVHEPPRPVLDVETAAKLIDVISKAVKRIEDVRAQNAISRKDFVRVMQEMARAVEAVVEKRLPDAAAREAMKAEIRDQWLEIRLA